MLTVLGANLQVLWLTAILRARSNGLQGSCLPFGQLKKLEPSRYSSLEGKLLDALREIEKAVLCGPRLEFSTRISSGMHALTASRGMEESQHSLLKPESTRI